MAISSDVSGGEWARAPAGDTDDGVYTGLILAFDIDIFSFFFVFWQVEVTTPSDLCITSYGTLRTKFLVSVPVQ